MGCLFNLYNEVKQLNVDSKEKSNIFMSKLLEIAVIEDSNGEAVEEIFNLCIKNIAILKENLDCNIRLTNLLKENSEYLSDTFLEMINSREILLKQLELTKSMLDKISKSSRTKIADELKSTRNS